jgi:hypothetical protein
MNIHRRAGAIFIAIFSLAIGVHANPIITVFNTGVGPSGTPLPDFTIGDPHYHLISVPGGTTDIQVRTSAGGFPVGLWLGDNSLSAWIGPNNPSNNDPAAVGEPGIFTYRTTFDLSGWVASTASIAGEVASDNWLVDVQLNGMSLGITTGFEDFGFFTPFTITTGFIDGINTLDFVVRNGSGPTGLRVQMTGSADLSAGGPGTVPDGSATAGLIGFAWLGFATISLMNHRARGRCRISSGQAL